MKRYQIHESIDWHRLYQISHIDSKIYQRTDNISNYWYRKYWSLNLKTFYGLTWAQLLPPIDRHSILGPILSLIPGIVQTKRFCLSYLTARFIWAIIWVCIYFFCSAAASVAYTYLEFMGKKTPNPTSTEITVNPTPAQEDMKSIRKSNSNTSV